MPFGPDPTATSVESLLSSEFGSSLSTEPYNDPWTTAWLSKFSTENLTRVICGQVVEFISYINAYRVCLGPRSGYIYCSDSAISGYQPYGARSINTIPHGSLVWLTIHKQTPWWGTIIAVEPSPILNSLRFRPDYIWPGSRCGLQVELCHQKVITGQFGAGGANNWSAGRPLDSLSIGEWGAMAETALANFLDSFMNYVRVNERCGLFMFHQDELARLAGYNLQVRSSLGEYEHLDDEGEIIEMAGWAMYWWERHGGFSNQSPLFTTIPITQVQQSTPEYNTVEPQHDDQQPFYRLDSPRGFLANGFRRSVCLPETQLGINRYSVQQDFPNVFTESIKPTGAYMLSSAKRIIITKRPAETPKQMFRQEDENGDSAANYNAAGGLNAVNTQLLSDEVLCGQPISAGILAALIALPEEVSSGSPSEAITAINTFTAAASAYPDLACSIERFASIISSYPSDPTSHLSDIADAIDTIATAFSGYNPTDPALPPALIRASAILDVASADLEWEAVASYYYHDLDWYLPEPGTSLSCLSIPNFSSLASNQFLSLPTPVCLPVDHRYGSAHYYPSESGIYLLDDGGVVITDGYGSELKMVAGSIYLSCPGEAWINSGKNINCWAGRDFIARAVHSADITASTHDVRIKAEQNVMVLAGNGGKCGGVLIEDRAPCIAYDYSKVGEDAITTGIVLKANKAQVVCWGQEVLLWGIPDPSLTVPGVIRTRSDQLIRTIKQVAFDVFVNQNNNEVAINEYWPQTTIFANDLMAGGNIEGGGCILANGNFNSIHGHFFSGIANQYSNLVPELSTSDQNTLQNYNTNLTNRISGTLSSIGGAETNYYSSLQNSLGDATFSLRTMQQYLTTNMIMFEPRWQQLERLDGVSPTLWPENSVTVASQPDTYPHPGRENWVSTGTPATKTFITQDTTLFDESTGDSIPRSGNESLYESPTSGQATRTIMKDNYRIITQS